MKKIIFKGKCIWPSIESKPNQVAVFDKTFQLETIPAQATAYIAVETRYFLYINGKPAVMDGGLFRESLPGCGYADEVDLTPFLVIGENNLHFFVNYFGNEGRNNINSGRAGLMFDCPVLGVYSDATFQCRTHIGYFTPTDDPPSYLHGGDHLGFDARVEGGEYKNAVIVDSSTWGDLYLRPIPLLRFREKALHQSKNPEPVIASVAKQSNVNEEIVRRYAPRNDGHNTYSLPHAMAFFPCLQVEANGSEKIQIYTDRYMVNGGPGDQHNTYRSHRVEYICKKGRNDFTSIRYLYGEEIIIAPDKPVKILAVDYIETGFDTDIVGYFNSGIPLLDNLVKKSARTLYVCMRDNLMDCPDRERGQWVGDISVQVPLIFFLLGTSARMLVRKAIMDFINLRKGDSLVGNVPGIHFLELPAQSLCAISQWGLIAQYVKYSGDESVLEPAFEPMVRYLKLWEMDDTGLLVPRQHGWRWFDHLHNIDEAVLENAWYYSALQFAMDVSQRIGNSQHTLFIQERLNTIKSNFDRNFWKDTHYASGTIVDDRANAMAVLSGLCTPDKFPQIRTVLISVFNASVYMENFVLTALCEMGYVADAYKRMCSRFYNLAVNENSTLWEDFFILGTKNHAWSGAPALLAFKYFMGIDTSDGFETYTASPCQEVLVNGCKCGFQGPKGMIHLTHPPK